MLPRVLPLTAHFPLAFDLPKYHTSHFLSLKLHLSFHCYFLWLICILLYASLSAIPPNSASSANPLVDIRVQVLGTRPPLTFQHPWFQRLAELTILPDRQKLWAPRGVKRSTEINTVAHKAGYGNGSGGSGWARVPDNPAAGGKFDPPIEAEVQMRCRSTISPGQLARLKEVLVH